MRKHNHLANARKQAANLLDGSQRTMLVEACHGVVDDHNLLRELLVLLQ